ncbi:hypothetical protein EKO27_g6232 [Xylaria grammica]|uniref:Protein kinase domain-containing protein n=1 Tax=Xylaria grammica TaxID=363999 RepID=A0A439D341_9PEZI|nr:hypothetical protein EKO27_g6232 [Xylaria grammica]
METPVAQIGAPARDVSPGELFRFARNVEYETRTAITSSRLWELERVLGHGSYGLTMLLRDRDPLTFRDHRRVVLKRALVPEVGVDDFVREATALEDLRGHSHISQLIAWARNTRQFQRTGRGQRIRQVFRRLLGAVGRNRPETIFRALGNIAGPAILSEYQPNGNLANIMLLQYENNIILPNRLLWGFYHCSELPPLIPSILSWETSNMAWLTKASGRNIMLGNTEPAVRVHQALPKLVLIDFGLSQRVPPGNEQMLMLINPRRLENGQAALEPVQWGGFLTLASGILDEAQYPTLDPDLRQLLAESFRCTADYQPERRPSLAETYLRTRRGTRKEPSEYPYQLRLFERDDSLRALLDAILYDVNHNRDEWSY